MDDAAWPEVALSTSRENLPSTPRPEYVEAEKDVALVRDLLAGTRRMQAVAAERDYVPKYPSEIVDVRRYTRRVSAAKVYGGLSRTISAAVGMLFAKPPKVDDRLAPEGAWSPWWENVDLAGTDGAVFAKRFAEDAIADGYALILTDFPPPPAGAVVTADAENRLNLRPYFRSYRRSDILSWRMGAANNRIVPMQVVLREARETAVGDYGMKSSFQYRVLRLVPTVDKATGIPSHVATWQVLVVDDATNTVESLGAGLFYGRTSQVGRPGVPFDELPVAVGYGGRMMAPFVAPPPLLDVAWANLYYWRKEITYNYHNELCGFPILHTEGLLAAKDAQGNPIPYQFGPDSHAQTEAGGKVEWAEMQGTSSALHVVALDREKRDMAELGMSFLAGDKRAAETAEAKRLDATAENATLSTAATGIDDALNLSLGFAARYLGVAPAEAPTVTLNRDFENVVMDAPTMLAYVTAVEKAGLDPLTLLDAWQRGGRIPLDADVKGLARDMMANMAAIADKAAADREAALAGASGAP